MYFGDLQMQWENDLHVFTNEYTNMDLTKISSKAEKQALAIIGRLKGYLQTIEGLFNGFKNNLQQAFQLNQQLKKEVKYLANARSHDIWKTVAFSVASLGLVCVTMLLPPSESLTSKAIGIGLGIATFGSGLSIKYDETSMQKIKEYETNLHSYSKLVQHDMKATDKMINIFHLAEKMLMEEIPFNKDKW